MARFGKQSREHLATCHSDLQKIFNKVIEKFDCSVLEGHRNKNRQNRLFDKNKTKVIYPNGRHNDCPSLAADVTPYPVNWNDRERQTLFAGYVIGIAESMNIEIRWGGDWDQDFQVSDNRFDDFPHFELRKK